MMPAYAHSGSKSDRSDWQLLEDHLRQVADLAAAKAAPLGLAEAARLAGKLHDFGKHDPAFDRVLQGRQVAPTPGGAVGRVWLSSWGRGGGLVWLFRFSEPALFTAGRAI